MKINIFYDGLRSLEVARRILRQHGVRELIRRVRKKIRRKYFYSAEYARWIEKYEALSPSDVHKVEEHIKILSRRPLFSIVMATYETEERWLRASIESVLRQSYPNWELCIADDASMAPHVRETLLHYQAGESRIKVVFREKNGHVSEAQNSALGLASGDYVAFLDHDDVLSNQALYFFALEVNRHPDADVLYSDEDKIDHKGKRTSPHFKPDWNPELLCSQNYVNHLLGLRRTLVVKVGGFRRGFEGSQDYDLLWRCVEKIPNENIRHIPRILYHWRAIRGSTARDIGEKPYAERAAVQSLQGHFERKGMSVGIERGTEPTTYRCRYPRPREAPLTSVLIPTRDGRSLEKCVSSLRRLTANVRYELIIIDNGSQQSKTLDFLSEIGREKNVSVLTYKHPFNFSAIMNVGVKKSAGEYLAFVNDDVEPLHPEWLEEMISHVGRPEVGVVGAKLLYPNHRIQHAGIILGIGGVASHSHKYFFNDGEPGYFSRLSVAQNVSAVSGACLLTRRDVYQSVGGFNEIDLPIAFNDVDYCLKVRERGFSIVWTPYARLIHHESLSRGGDEGGKKEGRFLGESDYMRRVWGDRLGNDPAYNPNLTNLSEDFGLGWPPRVSCPWEKELS